MTKEELKQEAEEYTKNLLKKLGIKEDMLLENQPKYLRQESMNFVALDVENVTDAYLASAEPREKRIAELKAQIEQLTYLHNEDVNTIKLLNERIREMRCCYNCKQSQDEGYCKIKKSDVNDLSCWDCGCDEWEIKEK